MEKHYVYPINLQHNLKTFKRFYRINITAWKILITSVLLFFISSIGVFLGGHTVLFSIITVFLVLMAIISLLIVGLTGDKATTIPVETLDDLNQIIGFEDGNYIPKYQFIDVDNTTPEQIVVDINYPHKAVEIIENKHLPLRRKSDAIHNAHVDASRKYFKKHTDKSLTSYVYARLDIRHAINDKSYEDAYSKRRLANAKQNATIPLEMRDDN